MSIAQMPKGASLLQVKFPVKTNDTIPNEQAIYGSLRVLVKKNGAPYTEMKAKGERTFLINQKIIDESWEVIRWGDGYAIAPITKIANEA